MNFKPAFKREYIYQVMSSSNRRRPPKSKWRRALERYRAFHFRRGPLVLKILTDIYAASKPLAGQKYQSPLMIAADMIGKIKNHYEAELNSSVKYSFTLFQGRENLGLTSTTERPQVHLERLSFKTELY